MTKFSDVVQKRVGGCSKCSSIIYTLPCVISRDIEDYLVDFGKPVYPLNAVKLLRIDFLGFHIEGRVGTKSIKFVMPKKYEKVPQQKIDKLVAFEKALADYITDTLHVEIE